MRKNTFVIWFTGLSGAGKTTTADALSAELEEMGIRYCQIDGDGLRQAIKPPLGFTKEGRDENIRLVVAMAKHFVKNEARSVICSFICPMRSQRDYARRVIEETGTEFVEVYCNTTLEVCEKRDVKGLYAKARRGEIPFFTGISDPYEVPKNPEVSFCTSEGCDVETNVNMILAHLASSDILKKLSNRAK